jgi:hypothetical protein
MQMGLRLTVEQCIQQKLCLQLQLTGGSTESIFPEVEKWLQQSSDHQMALRYVSKRNPGWQDRYQSVVDYLYAQVVRGARTEVLTYYKTGRVEDKARFKMTMAQRNFYAAQMVLALEIAYQCWTEKRAASWQSVREIVWLAA